MTGRNSEITETEDHSEKLLFLLDKYDKKIDEMKEEFEMKEIEILKLRTELGYPIEPEKKS